MKRWILSCLWLGLSLPLLGADCDAPVVAANDAVTIHSVTGGLIDALANDSNSAGHLLSIDSVNPTTGSWGTLTIEDGEVIAYQPSFGYEGTFNFTYTAGDTTDSSSDSAQVTVTVTLGGLSPLFGDGFETGNTNNWSAVSP